MNGLPESGGKPAGVRTPPHALDPALSQGDPTSRRDFRVANLVCLNSSIESARREDVRSCGGGSISKAVGSESGDRLAILIDHENISCARSDDEHVLGPSEGKDVVTGFQSPSFFESHSRRSKPGSCQSRSTAFRDLGFGR
jgi:hypothetical protein